MTMRFSTRVLSLHVGGCACPVRRSRSLEVSLDILNMPLCSPVDTILHRRTSIGRSSHQFPPHNDAYTRTISPGVVSGAHQQHITEIKTSSAARSRYNHLRGFCDACLGGPSFRAQSQTEVLRTVSQSAHQALEDATLRPCHSIGIVL